MPMSNINMMQMFQQAPFGQQQNRFQQQDATMNKLFGKAGMAMPGTNVPFSGMFPDQQQGSAPFGAGQLPGMAPGFNAGPGAPGAGPPLAQPPGAVDSQGVPLDYALHTMGYPKGPAPYATLQRQQLMDKLHGMFSSM